MTGLVVMPRGDGVVGLGTPVVRMMMMMMVVMVVNYICKVTGECQVKGPHVLFILCRREREKGQVTGGGGSQRVDIGLAEGREGRREL